MRYLTIPAIVLALLTGRQSAPATVPPIVEEYLERYFSAFPTRATEAGRHDHDRALEDLSPARAAEWVRFNRTARERLQAALGSDVSREDRLDGQVLMAQIERELHDLTVLGRIERDPLYWTSFIANAAVFLLVRDDLPVADRLERVLARVGQIPRVATQAQQTLGATDPSLIVADLCRLAAGQVRASAAFLRTGLPEAAREARLEARARAAGETAATSLDGLASFLTDLASRATGSFRLRDTYASTFRLGTRIEEPVEAILGRAGQDLERARREAAAYARSVWRDVMTDEPPPADDRALLARMFQRVAADRDPDVADYLERWRGQVPELESFVRSRRIITLPDPLTLVVDRSPSFFIGQSVGGVYPAGPFSPDAKTLLFVPVPPGDATREERDAFFRDFNRHFNRMIAPHELIPGHYVQLKYAARHPRRVRALFADPVFVEGWGTFCERLMLDEGWGGPLDRLAHLKKQLENIARTIVDIRVHTTAVTRDEVIAFVKGDALQDDQFAANMWTRAMTTSPQLTTYYLGYRQVREVYEAERRTLGTRFELRRFMDGMMADGPIPIRLR
jgi:hypothetical protein